MVSYGDNLPRVNFGSFPFAEFLDSGEKLSQLRSKFDFAIAEPGNELEVLWHKDEAVAFRVVTPSPPRTLIVSLARVVKSKRGSFFEPFVIADLVYKAIQQNRHLVKFRPFAIPSSLMHSLSELGFTQSDGEFIRFCFAEHLDRDSILANVAESCPHALGNYQAMSDLDLERSCSPVSSGPDQSYFLIPIRPGYALNLFDRQHSANDLFGGRPDVLLRWSNVYYRAPTLQNMLQVPGRVLWYVSGSRKQIVATSHLDEVVVHTPKELIRKYGSYGTLDWNDLYRMCKGDIDQRLMVLRFSHTFPMRKPITLSQMRRVFADAGIHSSLQGPRTIPPATFRKLFEIGYSERS